MEKSKKFTVSKNAEIEIEEVFRYQYENFGDKRAQKIENSILMFAQKAANNPNFYPPYLNNTNLNRNIRKALIHKTYVLIRWLSGVEALFRLRSTSYIFIPRSNE